MDNQTTTKDGENGTDKITISKDDALKIAADMVALTKMLVNNIGISPEMLTNKISDRYGTSFTTQCAEIIPLVTDTAPDVTTENNNSISEKPFNNVCNITSIAIEASSGGDLWSRLIRSWVMIRAVNSYMYQTKCNEKHEIWSYRLNIGTINDSVEWCSNIANVDYGNATNALKKFLEVCDVADVEYLVSLVLQEMKLTTSVIDATVTNMKPNKFNKYFNLAKIIMRECAHILGYQKLITDSIKMPIEQLLFLIDSTGYHCPITNVQAMTYIIDIIINQIKLIEKSLQHTWDITSARAFITDQFGKQVCVFANSDDIVVKRDSTNAPYEAVIIDITYRLPQKGAAPDITRTDKLYGDYNKVNHLLSIASKDSITTQIKIDTKQPVHGIQSKWYPQGTTNLSGSKGMLKYLDNDHITRLVPSIPLKIVDFDPFKQE